MIPNKNGGNPELTDSNEKRGWQTQSRNNQEDKKGGMYTNREHEIDYKIDMQIPLKNLNTVKKEWLDWDVDTRDREIQAIESTQTIRENK